ncbi:MAG: DUF2853 family protein [Paracoccaceae bacterium]|nr:DUF2853 family protein [Paracoccaceae bacterium]MDG2259803.1 DUF2853 family protein [Paracoccaceae bacterium]
MGRRQDLIDHYARDLVEKCRMEPDLALLEKVAIGCGPAIYESDGALIAASDPHEIENIKKNLLIRKLAMTDGPELSAAIWAVLDTYGRSEPRKFRAVVYYMLVKHFGREQQYL